MNAERKPTADEQAGMDWWNALPEKERATWLKVAVSARPADAWRVYQQVRAGEYRPDITWRPDPEFNTATRAEHTIVGAHELVAFDLPPTVAFPSHEVGWEIFTGPSLMEQIATGHAASFEEAKTEAERVFRDIVYSRVTRSS